MPMLIIFLLGKLGAVGIVHERMRKRIAKLIIFAVILKEIVFLLRLIYVQCGTVILIV